MWRGMWLRNLRIYSVAIFQNPAVLWLKMWKSSCLCQGDPWKCKRILKNRQNISIQRKRTCRNASPLELIPGFEPGTSSLPTDRKPNVYGIFCASGMRPSRVNSSLFESNHSLLGSNEGHSWSNCGQWKWKQSVLWMLCFFDIKDLLFRKMAGKAQKSLVQLRLTGYASDAGNSQGCAHCRRGS